ncbi:hypothetical protein ACFL3N_03365 [Candidatus Omnitrophota bacterium]
MDTLLTFIYDLVSSEALLKVERFQIRPKSERSKVVIATINVSKVIVPK